MIYNFLCHIEPEGCTYHRENQIWGELSFSKHFL